MGISFSHVLLLLIVVLILFGAGKLPSVMGDLAKGLKAFKDGMKDTDSSKDDSK
jgi:sec-independent protein translocase protein TatA